MPRVKATAAAELKRMASVNFVKFTGRCVVEKIVSRRWASLAVRGERHALRLCLEGEGAGEAADAFLDGLADREFDLGGHILADIALVSDERDKGGAFVRLGLEALTVEAG